MSRKKLRFYRKMFKCLIVWIAGNIKPIVELSLLYEGFLYAHAYSISDTLLLSYSTL